MNPRLVCNGSGDGRHRWIFLSLKATCERCNTQVPWDFPVADEDHRDVDCEHDWRYGNTEDVPGVLCGKCGVASLGAYTIVSGEVVSRVPKSPWSGYSAEKGSV